MTKGAEEAGKSEGFDKEQTEMVQKGDNEGICDKPLKTKVGNGWLYTGFVFFAGGDEADNARPEISCKNRGCCMDTQRI